MRPMTPSQRLIKLAQHFLAQWKTPDEQQFPGVLFSSDHERQPSIVDKDNAGWVYVKPPPDGSETSKRG